MAGNKYSHIFLKDSKNSIPFSQSSGGGLPNIPQRDRKTHSFVSAFSSTPAAGLSCLFLLVSPSPPKGQDHLLPRSKCIGFLKSKRNNIIFSINFILI